MQLFAQHLKNIKGMLSDDNKIDTSFNFLWSTQGKWVMTKERQRAANTDEIFLRQMFCLKRTDFTSSKGPLLTTKTPGSSCKALTKCLVWWKQWYFQLRIANLSGLFSLTVVTQSWGAPSPMEIDV